MATLCLLCLLWELWFGHCLNARESVLLNARVHRIMVVEHLGVGLPPLLVIEGSTKDSTSEWTESEKHSENTEKHAANRHMKSSLRSTLHMNRRIRVDLHVKDARNSSDCHRGLTHLGQVTARNKRRVEVMSRFSSFNGATSSGSGSTIT